MKEVLMILWCVYPDDSTISGGITTTRVASNIECRYIIESMQRENEYVHGKCITVTKRKDLK